MNQRAILSGVFSLLAGCAGVEPTGLDEGEEFVEDAVVVPEGKADDFLSMSAREYVVTGTASVTLEDRFTSATEAQRMARARELVSLRQIAIAWFLNQYLVDKDDEEENADYGGFGAMAKAGDYEALQIRRVGTSLRYTFQFRQLLAGRTNLMSLLPVRTSSTGARTFTLTVGRPTNEQMAQLETNHEWYRESPWDGWDPAEVSTSQKEDLTLTIAPEVESHDAWFDYARLFEDGVLDIDVHFGWDYHEAYHVSHARAFYSWLRERGFTSPVSSFSALTPDSGPLHRTIRANGRTVRVEVRIFYGKDGSITDPDTDAGGRRLEADMRTSLATRDVIVYSGHSGPFYGFALGNWRETEEGDLDDSEMSTVQMPADRYQIVVAEGCDTYQIGSAFAQNPAHPNLRGLDVITTTSFSNASTPAAVQDFVSRLIERDSRGRHRPRTVSSLLSDLDANVGSGFHTMYGIHGIDDNPRIHPYVDREMLGEACAYNSDCGELGNLCVRMTDGERACTAACTDDSGCPTDWSCRQIASSSAGAIYGRACVPN
jgi:hypothetical protein